VAIDKDPLLNPTNRLSGFLFQLAVKVLGILDRPRQVSAVAQRTHLRRRMPRRAGRLFVALKQDRITNTHFGEVIQHGTAHDAAPDNDN